VADLAQAQRALVRAERIAALEAIASDAARKELAVGQGTQLDVDAAGLALAAARAGAARAQGDVASARARLAGLLGRESSADLEVEDPAGAPQAPAAVTVEAVIDRAPRVCAADAALQAVRLERATASRSAWPEVTVGAFYGGNRRDIPVGSFHGPGSGGLSANWSDTEVGFRLELPIPLFERRQAELAAASGRILEAEAKAQRARADVRESVESAWAALQAARKAYNELSGTPEIMAREFDLLEKSFPAGALDAVARAVAMRNLQDAAATYDAAVRDLRLAEARWERWAIP